LIITGRLNTKKQEYSLRRAVQLPTISDMVITETESPSPHWTLWLKMGSSSDLGLCFPTEREANNLQKEIKKQAHDSQLGVAIKPKKIKHLD